MIKKNSLLCVKTKSGAHKQLTFYFQMWKYFCRHLHSSLISMVVARIGEPKNPYQRGKISTFDLLVPTKSDQIILNWFFKSSFLNEKVNRTEPSLSAWVPWVQLISLFREKFVWCCCKMIKCYSTIRVKWENAGWRPRAHQGVTPHHPSPGMDLQRDLLLPPLVGRPPGLSVTKHFATVIYQGLQYARVFVYIIKLLRSS